MAVTKLWSVKSNLKQVIDYAVNPEKTAADVYTEEQYQALADVLSYAKDEEKTERELYVDQTEKSRRRLYRRSYQTQAHGKSESAYRAICKADSCYPAIPLADKRTEN